MIRHQKNRKIATRNAAGEVNGFLVPIVNIHDAFPAREQFPQQVYLTVATPGEVKGPHLHKKRWGLFTCVKGNAKIVVRIDGRYEEYYTGEDHDYATIQVPAGVPNALVNIGPGDCYILNMPSRAWQPEDPDDWDVEFPGYRYF